MSEPLRTSYKWTPAMVEAACALVGQGLVLREVAARMGADIKTVRIKCRDFRRANGLDRAAQAWTPEEDAVLMRTDLTRKQKGELTGRHGNSVDRRMKCLGLASKRVAIVEPVEDESVDLGRGPLPPGHAVSWGAIALVGELWA